MCEAEEKHGDSCPELSTEATAYSFMPRQARLYTSVRPLAGATRLAGFFKNTVSYTQNSMTRLDGIITGEGASLSLLSCKH